MVAGCSRLLKANNPQEEKLESVQTLACSSAQQNFLAMVVKSEVI
jgi:hypothetical protein